MITKVSFAEQVEKLLKGIFYLSFKINTQTEHSVKFDYSGHVDCIYLDVSESKTNFNDLILDYNHIHLKPFDWEEGITKEKTEESIIEQLEEILDELQNIVVKEETK